MKAYISVGFSKRLVLEPELQTITEVLSDFNIKPFIFVDQYKFGIAQEEQMMKQAMRDIESCNILIAETSEKAIGVGVEVGFAKAKGKFIIYLRHENAEHSTTVSGISDAQIIYANPQDLKIQLTTILNRISTKI